MIQILGIGMKEAECQAIAIVGMKRNHNDDSPDQDSLQAVWNLISEDVPSCKLALLIFTICSYYAVWKANMYIAQGNALGFMFVNN